MEERTTKKLTGRHWSDMGGVAAARYKNPKVILTYINI